MPKRDAYPKPNSHTYSYAWHNTDTDTDFNSQPDRHTKRYAKANSNTQDSSDTKVASYSAGLKVNDSIMLLRTHQGGTRCPQRVGKMNAAWSPDICVFDDYFPSSSEKPIHLLKRGRVSSSAA